jgi:hypothetical protein
MTSQLLGGGGGSTQNNGNSGKIKSGFVLAFDLDNTLIDTTTEVMNSADRLMANIGNPQAFDEIKQETYRIIDPLVNNTLVNEVLKPATSLRGTKVDAILLLTNNLSTNYSATISMYFYDLFLSEGNAEGLFEQIREDSKKGDPRVPKVKHYFDYIMVRDHPFRPKLANPPKRFEEVKFMVDAIGKPTDNLIKRIFFFDDFINLDTMQKHYIRIQMAANGSSDQYIFVRGLGPFSSGGYTRGTTDSTSYGKVKKAFEEGITVKATKATAQASAQSTLASAVAELQATTGTDPSDEAEEKSLQEQQAYMASVSSKKSARPALAGLFSKGGYKRTRKNKNKKKKTKRRRH